MSPSQPQTSGTQATTNSPSWRLAFALLLWATATAGALAWVVHSSIGTAEKEFSEYGERFHAQLRERLRANEAVLYGFSAFLGAIPRDDQNAASLYARAVLERYPHIYMLEVVRRVPSAELHAFYREIRRKLNRSFEIRQFDYTGERTWRPAAGKTVYYPIILAEPDSDTARNIIGLDIDSLTGLRDALRQSERQGTPAASDVFRLVEGDQAYVLFRPVPVPSSSSAQTGIFGGLSYALMVIRASDLLPTRKELDPGIGHAAHFGSGNAQGLLFSLPATATGTFGRLSGALPTLRMERSIRDLSQPVTLQLERRMGLTDISGGSLATVSLASILSLTLLLGYVSTARQREHSREEAHRAIEHLALHDSLTGLPNRFLLFGRLEQALNSALRNQGRIAVLFLDLDGFKPINDNHGHHVGDEMLREVAHRLRQCVRDSDTVARHGGDEFVVVLTDILGTDAATAVADKILQAVARPFDIGGTELQVTTSIGIALYPDNAGDAEGLLRAADVAMYEAKAEGRRMFRLVATDAPDLRT